MQEAIPLIGACKFALDNNHGKPVRSGTDYDTAVQMIRNYFPEFDSPLAWRYAGTWGKKDDTAPIAAPIQEQKEEIKQEAKQQQEEVTPPPPIQSTVITDDITVRSISRRIQAGIRNIWLYGEAGTGKTTVCRIAADLLGIPCTIISISGSTSPSDIKGQKFPTKELSIFASAIQQPGIVVLDEITTGESDILSALNAVLEQGGIDTPCGYIKRHDDCHIIATANTTGNGGTAMYNSNKALDAATLTRFDGGFIHVDYSDKYEQSVSTPRVYKFIKALRECVKRNEISRIVSTRMMIAASKLDRAGFEWAEITDACIGHWTDDEKQQIRSVLAL
jgi:MoxR-like ATPase